MATSIGMHIFASGLTWMDYIWQANVQILCDHIMGVYSQQQHKMLSCMQFSFASEPIDPRVGQ